MYKDNEKCGQFYMPGRSAYGCNVEPVSEGGSQEFRRLAKEGKEDSSEAEADPGRKGNTEMSKPDFVTSLKCCVLELMNGLGTEVQIWRGSLAG